MNVKQIFKKLILQQWNIGFSETPIDDILIGKPVEYRWLQHSYAGRWFADPFILDVTDEMYVLLVEDFEDDRGYAVLSRLYVDRKTLRLIDAKTVLDVGTHLSFPIIERQDEYIYVYPENSESGMLNIYRYDKEREELIALKTIIKEPLTDAVMLMYDGKEWLFATKLPNPNGNMLNVYIKKGDVYELKGVVEMSGRTARMGGEFFSYGGKLYRPAQDNNKCYGGALILQEATVVDGTWSFRDIRRLTSPHSKYTTGLHTFNMYKGTIVVDVHGYRKHPWLSDMLTKAINSIRVLK